MSKVLYITCNFTELEMYFRPLEHPLLSAMLWAWPEYHYLQCEGLPDAFEEVPLSLFLHLLLLFREDNLSNCRFHHSYCNHSGRLLVVGVAEIISVFEKTLELSAAVGRKQLLLQRVGMRCSCPAAACSGCQYRCKFLLCQQSLLLETQLLLAKFVLRCTCHLHKYIFYATIMA